MESTAQSGPVSKGISAALFAIYWLVGYIGVAGGAAVFEYVLPNKSADPFDHLGEFALRVFWLTCGAALSVIASWIARETAHRKVWNALVAVAAGVGFFACLVMLTSVIGVVGVPLSALAHLTIVALGAYIGGPRQ